jgi:hypothetical protein
MPTDQIKLCKKDVCIEARGDNAKAITNVVTFTLFCMGLYYISKMK